MAPITTTTTTTAKKFISLLEREFHGSQGAGILFLCPSSGRILLVKRSQEVNEPGTWGIIGGAIDPGENPLEAALREAEEEIGVSSTRGLRLVPAFVFSQGDFRYHNFLGVVPKEFEPRLNWEADGYVWASLDGLPGNLHFGVKALLKNSLKLIEDTMMTKSKSPPRTTFQKSLVLEMKKDDPVSSEVSSNKEKEECLIDEEAKYPEGFSLDTLRNQGSLAAKTRYMAQFGLFKLGAGSSRVVFVADDKLALKLAKNKKGLAQNRLEVELTEEFRSAGFENLIAEVQSYDPEFLWVESERSLRAPSAEDWGRYMGFGPRKAFEILMALSDSRTYAKNKTKKEVLDELALRGVIASKEKEMLLGGHPLMDLNTAIEKFNLLIGDINRPSSWGLVIKPDGQKKVVLVDYGLNRNIFNTHYRR